MITEIHPHHKWYDHCRKYDVTFLKVTHSDLEFNEILSLRKSFSSTRIVQEDIDGWSEHYLARIGNDPAAALRVTRPENGALDCENYPTVLINELGSKICNASGFIAEPKYPLTYKLAHLLLEATWIDVINAGVRLNLMNVHERAVRYYGKMGYMLLANSFFVHPKLKTPSRVMIIPVSPSRDSAFKHIFESVMAPFPCQELYQIAEIEPWEQFKRTVKAVS